MTHTYSPQVYYQSPPFAVHQAMTQQFFSLPTPVCCLHGSVRLVMRGMVQRQTLGEVDDAEVLQVWFCVVLCGCVGGVWVHGGAFALSNSHSTHSHSCPT